METVDKLDVYYLCDDGKWRLAPAYDLTFSNSMGGEHATTIDGEGKNPTVMNILSVAKKAGINMSAAKQIASMVEQNVNQRLAKYLNK